MDRGITAHSDKLIKNNAYIDGANLHKGIEDQGWQLDYQRFRVYFLQAISAPFYLSA
ncbi:MAG: hypothetical protein WD883_02020 [Candidatus Colwellbacteria bacterium]